RAVAHVRGADVAVVRARRAGRPDEVGRTARARAGAGLRQVAFVRRRAAERARVPGGVLAGDTRAVAGVGGARVAVVRACRSGDLLGVGRTVGAIARAALGEIAGPRGRTADGARGLEEIGRAAGATARARLGDVAGAGRRAADGAGVARVVHARGRADRAVAHVRGADVAVVRARRPGRLDQVGRAARTRAGAGLRQIALVRRRAADGARVPGGVLAGDVSAVAGMGGARVAVAGARGPARLPDVGRTIGTVALAGLGQITLPGGRATDRARGCEDVGRAAGAIARTPFGDVAGAGSRTALDGGGLERIRRAGGARPRAGLGEVARASRRTALDRRRLERVCRTRGARARAGFGDVTLAGSGSALDGPRLERIGRARGGRSRAGFGDVALTRGGAALGSNRLELVDRAHATAAGAHLGDVAGAGRRAADGARVARIVHARRHARGAVAHVGRADVAVVGARRAGRLDEVGRAARGRARAGLRRVAFVDRRAAERARVPGGVMTGDARDVASVVSSRV